MSEVEHVVLLDELGRAVGSAPKQHVHHASTPLHLAFSCYIFDPDERLLVSQRALSKKTFPGVWTNSACGHPAPSEKLEDAVRRRVRHELGLGLRDLTLVLPEFRYTATMDGIRENEMCPVWVATTDDEVVLDPTEVEAFRWQPWADFRRGVLDGSLAVSQWCHSQVAALDALGPSPAVWPAADRSRLPMACDVEG